MPSWEHAKTACKTERNDGKAGLYGNMEGPGVKTVQGAVYASGSFGKEHKRSLLLYRFFSLSGDCFQIVCFNIYITRKLHVKSVKWNFKGPVAHGHADVALRLKGNQIGVEKGFMVGHNDALLWHFPLFRPFDVHKNGHQF